MTLGIITGYTDGTFQPNKPVSHQEAVVLVVRLLGLEEEAQKRAKNGVKLPFKNENSISTWARGHIAMALELGLLDKNEKFQGNKAASRIFVTSLMVKGLGIDVDHYKGRDLEFSDLAHLTAEERLELAVAVSENLAKGYGDKTFQPNKPVTRGEIAAFLERMLDYISDHDDYNDIILEPIKGYFTSYNSRDQKMTFIREGRSASDLKSVTYTLSDKAIIYYNGKKRSTLDVFKDGDRLEVILNNEGKIIFVSGESKKDDKVVWDQLKNVSVFNVKLTSGQNSIVYSYDAAKPNDIYVLTQKNGKSSLLQGKEAATAIKAAIDTHFKAGSTFDLKKTTKNLALLAQTSSDKEANVSVQYKTKESNLEFSSEIKASTNATKMNWSKGKATIAYTESTDSKGKVTSNLQVKDPDAKKEISYKKEISDSKVTASGYLKLEGLSLEIKDTSLEPTIKQILGDYKFALYGETPKTDKPKDEYKNLTGIANFNLEITSGKNSYLYQYNKDRVKEMYVLTQKDGKTNILTGDEAAAAIKKMIDTHFKTNSTFDSKEVSKNLVALVQNKDSKDSKISLNYKTNDRTLVFDTEVKSNSESTSYTITQDKVTIKYSHTKDSKGKVVSSIELRDTEAKKELKYTKEVENGKTTASGYLKLDGVNLTIDNTQYESTITQIAKDYKVKVSF